MYVRGCISVWEREVEGCTKCCMRFMMMSCEGVELRRVLKTLGWVVCKGLATLVLF